MTVYTPTHIFMPRNTSDSDILSTWKPEFFVTLDGALLPVKAVGQWTAFESFLSAASAASGTLGLGGVARQDELITGTEGDDTLNGGLGNDTILGLGGTDFINGGEGDDSLNPGDNNFYDQVDPGAGNDTIDLGDVVNGFIDIVHWDMNGSFIANFNGLNGTLNFDKGVNGTTTVLNALNAVNAGDTAGGLMIFGTGFDDTFNITAANGGFLLLRAGAGDDTLNIFAGGDGTVRLDYRQGIMGIDANLATGIITDSFGDTDTLGGSDFFTELRATMFADNILGSDRDERFITMGGNDTVDGGGGWDIQRYDRSGVDAIVANLNTGIVTGTWTRDGSVSNFTHTLMNIEEIRGSRDGDDNITGNGGDNTFEGRGGDDTMFGGGGNDRLVGDDGNDDLYGGDGRDDLVGGNGDDSLNPGDNTDYDLVNPGEGNDTVNLNGVSTGYVVIGHWELDAGFTANFNGVNGTLNFDKGVNGTTTVLNVLNAIDAGNTTGGLGIEGTNSDDIFNITRATDGYLQVSGGRGNDTFNIFAGGGGTVRLDYRFPRPDSGIDANLATGIIIDGFGDTDTLGGSDFFTELRATMFADNIVGSDRDERFISLGGNDTVDGGGGWDIQRYDRGGVGAVTVNLNTGVATGTWDRDGIVSNFTHTLSNIEEIRGSHEGDDLLIGNGDDNRLRGRGGDDTLFGNAGDDRLDGGDGNDLLGGGDGDDWLYGDAGNDALYTAAGDDRAFGGTGNDTLGGAGGNDELHGEEGNDQLWGAVGDDTLFGGEGDDTLGGSVGDDELHGNDGNDEMWGSDGNDELYGGEGNDTLGGSVGNDTLSGEGGNDELWGADGIDDLNGGDGDDRIGAGAGDDVVLGGFGNDQMFGGLGNDFLGGNDGNDTIYGAAGDDTINGNGGDDEMYAGPGFDEIQFSTGDDIVFFFSTADDVVNLSFASGITSFSDLQNNHLSEVGGSAVITDDNGDTLTLNGVTAGSLALDDFIF